MAQRPAGRPARTALGPLAAGMALGLLGGCLGLGSLREIAFPASVAGLPADRTWQPLPVGVWMTEGEVEAVAIAGCLAPDCAAAAVGVFRAAGRSGERLLAEAAEPARLVQALSERSSRRAASRPGARRSAVAGEPLRSGRFSGALVRLSGRDGPRPAYGVGLASRRDGAALVVVVVARSEDDARRIANGVAAALG